MWLWESQCNEEKRKELVQGLEDDEQKQRCKQHKPALKITNNEKDDEKQKRQQWERNEMQCDLVHRSGNGEGSWSSKWQTCSNPIIANCNKALTMMMLIVTQAVLLMLHLLWNSHFGFLVFLFLLLLLGLMLMWLSRWFVLISWHVHDHRVYLKSRWILQGSDKWDNEAFTDGTW